MISANLLGIKIFYEAVYWLLTVEVFIHRASHREAIEIVIYSVKVFTIKTIWHHTNGTMVQILTLVIKSFQTLMVLILCELF